jgi:hypothetical protein
LLLGRGERGGRSWARFAAKKAAEGASGLLESELRGAGKSRGGRVRCQNRSALELLPPNW